MSPMGSCPGLKRIDASGCENLEYLFIQSRSLTDLDISNCKALKKVSFGPHILYSLHQVVLFAAGDPPVPQSGMPYQFEL